MIPIIKTKKEDISAGNDNVNYLGSERNDVQCLTAVHSLCQYCGLPDFSAKREYVQEELYLWFPCQGIEKI